MQKSVHYRDENQGGERREKKAADHRAGQGRILFAALADAERHGNHANDHRARCHQHRPQPRVARRDGCLAWSIAGLYALLEGKMPSPVVRLNRAVAVAMAGDIEAGLAIIDELSGDARLERYYLLDATRADLLRRQLVIGPQDQAARELARKVRALDPQPASAPLHERTTCTASLLSPMGLICFASAHSAPASGWTC